MSVAIIALEGVVGADFTFYPGKTYEVEDEDFALRLVETGSAKFAETEPDDKPKRKSKREATAAE